MRLYIWIFSLFSFIIDVGVDHLEEHFEFLTKFLQKVIVSRSHWTLLSEPPQIKYGYPSEIRFLLLLLIGVIVWSRQTVLSRQP